jgi:polyphosphate kinase 2 (PPK2 family)
LKGKGQPKRKTHKTGLHGLQVEVVKLQQRPIKNSLRMLIEFEGRDASGKDIVNRRTTKRVTQH